MDIDHFIIPTPSPLPPRKLKANLQLLPPHNLLETHCTQHQLFEIASLYSCSRIILQRTRLEQGADLKY